MDQKRIVEIDLLRVTAIVLMVVFHFVYDLKEFVGVNVDYSSMLWYCVGKAAALLFIFVSGISSCLGTHTLKRGVQVFGCGMLITIATWFFAPEEYIRFGILHFLGVAILLSALLKQLKGGPLLLIAILSVVIGVVGERIVVVTPLLLPFGLMYDGFQTMDYYPLFPYLSVFILGIIAYQSYYIKGNRLLRTFKGSKWINFISSHSLLIYLLHQPLIVGIMIVIVKFG